MGSETRHAITNTSIWSATAMILGELDAGGVATAAFVIALAWGILMCFAFAMGR